MHPDTPCVVALEVAVAALMKMDHDGHYLAGRELARSASMLRPIAELFSMPVGLKPFEEIVDMTEKWE